MRIGEAKTVTELVDALEDARVRRRQLRLGYEAQWWNNLAMLAGDHFAEFDPVTMGLVERPKESHKVRLPINHTLTVARTELAKIRRSRPIATVLPAIDATNSVAATRVALKLLENCEWDHQLTSRRKRALWWCIATGFGGLYIGWDPNNDSAGSQKFTIDPRTNLPVVGNSALSELNKLAEEGVIDPPEEEEVPYGEFDIRVYSPFQILPQEGLLELAEMQEVITEDIVNLDEAVALYGRAAAGLNPTKPNIGAIQTRILSRLSIGTTLTNQVQGVEDALSVYTWWLEPGLYRHNKFLRDGLMIRWVPEGKTVLEFSDEFPFVDRRLPFTWFEHTPAAASIWPDCTITHVRPINLELDKKVSQLVENIDHMGNPMWVVATQSQVKDKIRNIPGAIVRYRHVPNVPPPQQVPGVPMPGQVENLVVGLRDQILDVSGQSEVSRGRMPAGVRSGVQAGMIQAEDETRIDPVVENFELAIARQGSLILSRYSQFYPTERLVRLYRPDGTFEVIKFKGTDIRGATDVIIQPDSSLPQNKAARREYVLQLAQLGLETDPKRLKDMLELGDGEPDEWDIAFQQAFRENQAMLGIGKQAIDPQMPQEMGAQGSQPQAIPVRQYHNHKAHLQKHYALMNSGEFEDLAKKYPELQRLFEEHTAMHEQALMAQQMAQMQAMLAARGGPEAMMGAGPGMGKPGATPNPMQEGGA